MEISDLPHQRKSQSRAAVLAAAGFVYPEEGMENAPLILLRNAAASVGNANDALFLPLCKLDPHRAAEAVVFDSVLRQVEEHAVDQRVAAGQGGVALRFQRDASLLRQRRKIRKDLLDHGGELELLVPRHLLQIAHLQQRLGHLRQPFRLLTQKHEELRRLRPHIRMLRDKAMLELLYATGMRVSELVSLRMEDVNLRFGWILCRDEGRERMIPFGEKAGKALLVYLERGRDAFLKKDTETLFLNCSGAPMSRQGFWKVLKGYAARAGIEKDITPRMFRHSCAAHMAAGGARMHMIQELLGYSDLTAAQIYAGFQPEVKNEYSKVHPRG